MKEAEAEREEGKEGGRERSREGWLQGEPMAAGFGLVRV